MPHVETENIARANDGQGTGTVPFATDRPIHGRMRDSTYNIVKAALESDDTIGTDQRKAILSFCREPIPRPAPADQPSEERYLLTRETAAALKVAPRTVQRWIRAGRLESRRVVGCRRVPWSAVLKLCDGGGEPESRLSAPTGAADCRRKDGKDAR